MAAAPFVITSRAVLLGVAWTGTAPGVANPTPSGTITTPQDFSNWLTSGGEPGSSSELKPTTNMSSGGYVETIPGLTSADDIVLQFNGDFAASNAWVIVQTTLGGLSVAGSSVRYADIKATSAARSATNPSYVAAVWLKSWKPMKGAVGDVAGMELTLSTNGKFTYLTA